MPSSKYCENTKGPNDEVEAVFFEWLLSVNVYTLSRKMTAFKALEAFIVVLYCIHKKHAVEKIYYTEVSHSNIK